MVDAKPESITTKDETYSKRLQFEESIWWKRLIDVQLLYRWNLKRIEPGFTIDIGCGLGRNLINLGGRGIGIDHNPRSVEIAKSRGLHAYTPNAFKSSEHDVPNKYDSILMSHVAEHMTEVQVVEVLGRYEYLVRPGGQIIIITPQEYGYRADPTHVQFMDFDRLRRVSKAAGFTITQEYSFPFPRFFGPLFRYNEFISISRKPAQ